MKRSFSLMCACFLAGLASLLVGCGDDDDGPDGGMDTDTDGDTDSDSDTDTDTDTDTDGGVGDGGLVAYYPFNGNANDESGNGNDGEIQGAICVQDMDGNADSALQFNGKSDRIAVQDSTSLDASTGLTITAWINSQNGDGKRPIAVKWDDQGGDHSFIFKAADHDCGTGSILRIELSAGDHNDLADLCGNTEIALDSWVHVAAVFNGAEVRLYLNGDEDGVTDAVGSIANSATKLYIGACYLCDDRNEYFEGIIDEVRIYNRPLSKGEIRYLFNEGV